MSLIKQLWIAIAVVTALAFGGSMVISTLSARHYLEQQLHLKNMDNATSLALTISQLSKDPVTLELLISAQFDTGHYRSIHLSRPDGAVFIERSLPGNEAGIPDWFVSLVPIDALPGVAQVQDGWHQFGTLSVESHSRFAYEALWRGTMLMLMWFLAGATATGILGTLFLRHIMRPLKQVITQAEALGDRRFITTEEPPTPEFRSLVKAMNRLSARIRAMFAEESQRLEAMRKEVQEDPLTGLLVRRQFLNQLDSALSRDDAGSGGSLLIARLGDLNAINGAIGRDATDQALRAQADALRAFSATEHGSEAGRLNGSELALLVRGNLEPEALAHALHAALCNALKALPDKQREAFSLTVGGTAYHAGDAISDILTRIDGALSCAAGEGVHLAPEEAPAPFPGASQWREALDAALDGPGIRLQPYPVLGANGQLIHLEAPVRLSMGGHWQSAGHFMPWAARLGIIRRIDLEVVRHALQQIGETGQPMGVNISGESFTDKDFCTQLLALAKGAPKAASLLWIDVCEHDVITHRHAFRSFCTATRATGCKLGIEHVDRHFGRIGDLHELGVDYLKLDTSMVRHIDTDAGNQAIVRGLSILAHAIGLTVIAEGVATPEEHSRLFELGIDGVTGPGIRD